MTWWIWALLMINTNSAFMISHATRPLNSEDEIPVLKLMELQRHLMLMYTSCGWFFDELSGIETVQNIKYAGRVLQLTDQLFSEPLNLAFSNLLSVPRATYLNTVTAAPYMRNLSGRSCSI